MQASPRSELVIRARRAAFNRALAQADLAAIGPLLARDVVLITGTDSAAIIGRKAQLQVWKREFAVASRTLYVRRPEAVLVSTVYPIALEQGNWEGVAKVGGETIASGAYSAKWRETEEGWVIEGELFLTLA